MTNQVQLSALLAMAVADIAKQYENLLQPEFLSQKAWGRATMAAAAADMGLSAREGEKVHDDGFMQIVEELREWILGQANKKIVEALAAAEAEVERFTRILTATKVEHGELIRKLINYYTLPEEEELAEFVKESNNSLVEMAERNFRSLMVDLATRHRLVLSLCFNSRMVSEEITSQLVSLYEVK